MTFQLTKLFKEDLDRLQEITKHCRPDMHEPDEQDIYAEFGPSVVVEKWGVRHPSLDNACCGASGDMGFWIIKRKYDDDGNCSENREWFNLANIIALARQL